MTRDVSTIKGFLLENPDKVLRAAEGYPTARGKLEGGVGYEDEDKLLAQYDRLGGLITENGRKVKTGSFFDFATKMPRKKPEVVYVVKVAERFVDVPKGEPIPIEAQAAEIVEKEEKAPKKKGKRAKK